MGWEVGRKTKFSARDGKRKVRHTTSTLMIGAESPLYSSVNDSIQEGERCRGGDEKKELREGRGRESV